MTQWIHLLNLFTSLSLQSIWTYDHSPLTLNCGPFLSRIFALVLFSPVELEGQNYNSIPKSFKVSPRLYNNTRETQLWVKFIVVFNIYLFTSNLLWKGKVWHKFKLYNTLNCNQRLCIRLYQGVQPIWTLLTFICWVNNLFYFHEWAAVHLNLKTICFTP